VSVAEVAAFLGLLPHYASANAKIFCNKNIFHTLFERLAYTAGGATATEFVNGVPQYKYQGIPVVISQVMTGTSASSYLAYYGDMKLSSYFGDRADTRIAFSDSALNAFEQDEKVIRGTTRFDIVNANVGSASASGAMVALVL
jgi:HK97 family phage major capsid protein